MYNYTQTQQQKPCKIYPRSHILDMQKRIININMYVYLTMFSLAFELTNRNVKKNKFIHRHKKTYIHIYKHVNMYTNTNTHPEVRIYTYKHIKTLHTSTHKHE